MALLYQITGTGYLAIMAPAVRTRAKHWIKLLLDRKPHSEASTIVWIAVETDRLEGLLAAHAITAIHCLTRYEPGEARARATIAALLQVFGIAKVDGEVIRHALDLPWPDFEDSVSAAAAQTAGCDLIVTLDATSSLQEIRKGSPARSFGR